MLKTMPIMTYSCQHYFPEIPALATIISFSFGHIVFPPCRPSHFSIYQNDNEVITASLPQPRVQHERHPIALRIEIPFEYNAAQAMAHPRRWATRRGFSPKRMPLIASSIYYRFEIEFQSTNLTWFAHIDVAQNSGTHSWQCRFIIGSHADLESW